MTNNSRTFTVSLGFLPSGRNEKALTFLPAAWWIWRCKNMLVFQNKAWSDIKVRCVIGKSIAEMTQVYGKSAVKPTTQKLVKWVAPPLGYYKLDVDGNALGNPGGADFGGLIRNSEGERVVGFSGFTGISTNTHAELVALHEELKLAWSWGIRKLLCNSDSMSTIELVLSDWSLYHCYATILHKIKQLLHLD